MIYQMLQATGYRLQATGYRLQATGYRLQATGYRLQATGYRLQATKLLKGLLATGLLLLVTVFNARGQNVPPVGECLTTDTGSTLNQHLTDSNMSCSHTSQVCQSFFEKQSSFIPTDGILTPATVIKTIKIRFIIPESDSTSPIQTNFRQSNMSDLQFIVDTLNGYMSNLWGPNYPATSICGSCYIPDERIRVKLVGVDFVKDTNSYCYSNCQPQDVFASEMFYNDGDGTDSVLNIFLYTDSSRYQDSTGLFTWGGWVKAVYDDLKGPKSGKDQAIFLMNSYMFTKTYPEVIDSTFGHYDCLAQITLNLMHELHHCLGLFHIYQEFPPDSRDYLPDVFPLGYPTNTAQDSIYNIMRAHNWNPYVSPLQIGRANRNCFMGVISKFAYPTEAPNTHPWVVDSDETWDFPIRMFQDIVVESGATLTIKCLVQMPSNSLIVVKKGGKLIIDGGHITSYNALRTWGGIEAEGQPDEISDAQYQGSVIIKNGAIIERAQNGVKNYLTRYCKACIFGNPGGGGGIIYAKDSWFYNCARAVKLAYYPNYNYASENCYFVADSFVWDDPHFAYNPAGMFTTWDIKGGIKIWNCTFKNAISRDSVNHEARGLAIEMESTSAYLYANHFDGFYGGVFDENYSGLPGRNVQVFNNYFNRITANVMFGAGCFGEIKGNDFTNMYGWASGEFEGDVPVNNNYGYAVYLDHSTGTYVGCGNEIYGTTNQPNSTQLMRYGVIVNNSGSFGDIVLDNYYYDLPFGIQTQLNNPALTLYCNHHFNNGYAWVINPQSNSNAYSLMNQGTGYLPNIDLRAHSTFSGSGVMDIASYLDNSWNYYAWDTVGGQYPFYHIGSVNAINCSGSGIDPNDPCSPSFHTNCTYEIYHPSVLDSLLEIYNHLSIGSPSFTLEHKTLFGAIIRGYAQLDDNQGMLAFLENQHSDEARRLLIPLYIANRLFNKVQPAIDSLSLSRAEKQGYSDYYSLLSDLKQSDRSIFDLTQGERNTVTRIAEDSLEVSPYAKSLLDFVYGEKWVHPIEAFPGSGRASRFEQPTDANKASNLGNAVPNPAHNVATIPVYIAPKDAGWHPKLIIHTITGRPIAVKDLQSGKNTIKLNTASWQPGLYFYSLELKGKVLKTKRLSILK